MKQTIGLLSFLLCITTHTICMRPKTSIHGKKGVDIKTSDNQLYRLPQSEIEFSRVLHTKQELLAFTEKCPREELYPLTLKTITKKQLKLFYKAVIAENFAEHYQKRTPKEKRQLINLAGETQLMSPILTIQLVLQYFDKNIVNHIASYLTNDLDAVHNYLRRSLIIHNLTCSRYKQSTTNYHKKRYMITLSNGEYHYIPTALSENYNGLIINEPVILQNLPYLLLNVKKKNEDERYFITPAKTISNPFADNTHNEITIWLVNSKTKTQEIKNSLKHVGEIENIIFSNNGKYLLTSSCAPGNELIITYLERQDKTPAFSHRILQEHEEKISYICFNNASTIAAVGSENGIQLIDIKTLSSIKKLDLPGNGMNVETLLFNDTDTLLAASISLEGPSKYTIQLYDTSKPDSTVRVGKIKKTIEQVQDLKFYANNSLVIPAEDRVIVLDGLGNIIMETKKIPRDDARFSLQTTVMMPDIDMLITARATDREQGDTKIWDMQSKKIIGPLLLNANEVMGVGISKDDRSIITIHRSYVMTKTDLYTTNNATALEWIKKEPSLLQKYLLLRLYRAKKLDCSVDLNENSIEYTTFDNLPTTPSNVKRLVKNHLFKKSISK